jgi:hypothetical protein
MTYVLLGIVILITIANFTLLMRVRKNKRIAAEKYQELMTGLRDRTIKVMKKHRLHFDRTYPLVADNDEGFLFCLDTTHRMAAFTDHRKVQIFPYREILSSTIEVEPTPDNPKFYEHVRLVIGLDQNSQGIVIELGHKRTRRTGIMGRFVLETAHQMDKVLQEVIESNAHPESTQDALLAAEAGYGDTDEE